MHKCQRQGSAGLVSTLPDKIGFRSEKWSEKSKTCELSIFALPSVTLVYYSECFACSRNFHKRLSLEPLFSVQHVFYQNLFYGVTDSIPLLHQYLSRHAFCSHSISKCPNVRDQERWNHLRWVMNHLGLHPHYSIPLLTRSRHHPHLHAHQYGRRLKFQPQLRIGIHHDHPLTLKLL
jgi:hypothetical protein